MYMMHGGSKPVGEVYLTPPNGKSTKMVMHYYDGTEITLAEFKTKQTSDQAGSIESRIRNCEQHILPLEKYLVNTLGPAILRHNSEIDSEGRYSSQLRTIGSVEDPIFDKELIEPKDDTNNDRYDTEYHLENYDHWR